MPQKQAYTKSNRYTLPPIALSSLPSGLYRIKGNYYITNDTSGICFIDASGSNLYAVSKEDNAISMIGPNTVSIYSLLSDGKYKEASIQSTSQIIQTIKTDLSQTYALKADLESVITKHMADNETLFPIVDKHVSESFVAINEKEISDLFN